MKKDNSKGIEQRSLSPAPKTLVALREREDRRASPVEGVEVSLLFVP